MKLDAAAAAVTAWGTAGVGGHASTVFVGLSLYCHRGTILRPSEIMAGILSDCLYR